MHQWTYLCRLLANGSGIRLISKNAFLLVWYVRSCIKLTFRGDIGRRLHFVAGSNPTPGAFNIVLDEPSGGVYGFSSPKRKIIAVWQSINETHEK
jgi:hypothetical protein